MAVKPGAVGNGTQDLITKNAKNRGIRGFMTAKIGDPRKITKNREFPDTLTN